ncbi:MAG: hypothetical protein ACRDOK_26065 [Streptosporangiaceae bacterium]
MTTPRSPQPGPAPSQNSALADRISELLPQAGDQAPPRCDDSVTIRTCPACGQPFTWSGRRRWCSDACKQAAYRRRATPPAPARPALPARRPKRPVTVYECGQCGLRALGRQRCDDCGKFMSAVGTGNLCPRCDEPVAIRELSPPPEN